MVATLVKCPLTVVVILVGLLLGAGSLDGQVVAQEKITCTTESTTLAGGGAIIGEVCLITVNLTVHNGQSGPAIPEGEEESPGAFTVANLNDTDADGTVDKDDTTVKANPDGRNEVDLVKVVIDKPIPDKGGNVTLRLTGDGDKTKLWKKPTKEDLETRRQIATSDLPLTMWLEGLDKSGALRDITIRVTYRKATDEARVTFVWAERTAFTNTGMTIPGDLDLQGLKDIINANKAADGTLFGHGPFLDNGTGVNTWFGGRMLMEFKVYPPRNWGRGRDQVRYHATDTVP